MGYRVAVVGATGAVGREMMAILEETNFRVDEIHALASRASKGAEVSFGDRIVRCEVMETFDFSKVDIVLMSAGADISRDWSERIGAAGPVVIDNSSAWRMHPQVPLVVPEVNPDAVEGFRAKRIIANPNCSTIQLVVALAPLHEEARIKRVVVSTYQSTSGAGKDAMDELWTQTKNLYGLGDTEPKLFTKQIASRTSTTSSTTAPPRKSGRWPPRPRRSSTPRSSSPPPAFACPCSSATPSP
jgi:aspartate-semialdehyde dehydrogenase